MVGGYCFMSKNIDNQFGCKLIYIIGCRHFEAVNDIPICPLHILFFVMILQFLTHIKRSKIFTTLMHKKGVDTSCNNLYTNTDIKSFSIALNCMYIVLLAVRVEVNC